MEAKSLDVKLRGDGIGRIEGDEPELTVWCHVAEVFLFRVGLSLEDFLLSAGVLSKLEGVGGS